MREREREREREKYIGQSSASETGETGTQITKRRRLLDKKKFAERKPL